MAEIIAYAAADPGVGFREYGVRGFYKTPSHAYAELGDMYEYFENHGWEVIQYGGGVLIVRSPDTDMQKAYWMIHI